MNQVSTTVDALKNQDVKKLATGASVSLVGKVVGQGLQALSRIVIARLLGPGAFGLYTLGWTFMRMAGVIGPLGLNNAVIHFGSRYWHRDNSSLKRVLSQSLLLALGVGSLLGAILYFIAPQIEISFEEPGLTPIIRWFAGAFALASGLKVAAAATKISQRMRFSVLTEDLGQPTINLLLVLLFYSLGFGLKGAAATRVFSYGLAFLGALYFTKNLFSEAFPAPTVSNSPSIRRLLAFSLPTTLAGMFVMLMSWSTRLLIGYFLPATDLGIYEAVAQSSLLFATIINALNAIFSPMIADLYHKNKRERLDELFKISTKWGLYLCLPVFLVICFAPQAILTVLFGHQYAKDTLPLIVLSVSQLINVGTGSVGFLLIMTGHQNHWMVISGSMLALSLGLNWLLIPLLGILGAALATTAATVGLFLFGLFNVKRSLGLWPYDHRYFKGAAATLLTVVALFLQKQIAIDSSVIRLLLAATVSGGVFGGTLLLLGLDIEDREFVNMILSRLGIEGFRF